MVSPTIQYFPNNHLPTLSSFSNLGLQNGDSPLHYAIRHQNKELLQKALDAGFLITERNRDGLSAFDLAINLGEGEFAALLLQKTFGIDAQQMATLLDRRTIVNGLSSVEKAIHEWQSKAARENKMSPASRIAAKGDLEALKELSSGAFNQTDANGLTPLHYAILAGQEKAIDYLIPFADPGCVTADQSTYLHFAAMAGKPSIVQLLQKMGINANAVNAKGWTAAHFLAASNSSHLVSFAKSGAAMTIKSPQGLTPFGLLVAKAIAKEPATISSKDIWLAFLNIINIMSALSIKQSKQSGDFLYTVGHSCKFLVSSFAKQWLISTLPPAQNNKSLEWCVSPRGIFVNCIVLNFLTENSKHGIYVGQAATTYVVGKNALSQLGHCFSNFWDHPWASLASTPVHLFNAGSEILNTLSLMGINTPGSIHPNAFEEFISDFNEWKKNHFGNGSQDNVPKPPPSACDIPANLPKKPLPGAANKAEILMRRAIILKAECKEQAEMILEGTGKYDQATCRSQYRKLSLLFHPDKYINDTKLHELAKKAFPQLVTAYEKVCNPKTVTNGNDTIWEDFFNRWEDVFKNFHDT